MIDDSYLSTASGLETFRQVDGTRSGYRSKINIICKLFLREKLKREDLIKPNDLNPLCPILALAIFISINGYNPSGFLFTSHVAATDRFGKVFKKILTFLRVIHEYIDACLDDIASHSGRKV